MGRTKARVVVVRRLPALVLPGALCVLTASASATAGTPPLCQAAPATALFDSGAGDAGLGAGALWPGGQRPVGPGPAGRSSLFGDGILAQRVLDEDEKVPRPKEDRPVKPKNPWKAMLFSAALPGAGQFYVKPGNLLSLGFVGVEAVSWYLRSVWQDDGNAKIAEYKQYAWTGAIDEAGNILRDEGRWSWERWRESRGDPGSCSPPVHDYDEVDSQLVVFWFTNDREFYEDIGKYEKYCSGWRDDEFRQVYQDMREESNDLLDRSRRMSQVILLNHVASAIHAYFAARSHNNRLAESQSGSNLRWDVVPDAGGALRAQVVYTRRF